MSNMLHGTPRACMHMHTRHIYIQLTRTLCRSQARSCLHTNPGTITSWQQRHVCMFRIDLRPLEILITYIRYVLHLKQCAPQLQLRVAVCMMQCVRSPSTKIGICTYRFARYADRCKALRTFRPLGVLTHAVRKEIRSARLRIPL